MLLTVPIFAPIAMSLGFDPLAYALIGILAIAVGILTPPFGLLVYTVKAAIPDKSDPVTMMQIFKGSTPYWMLLVLIVLLYNYPGIVTYLPAVVFQGFGGRPQSHTKRADNAPALLLFSDLSSVSVVQILQGSRRPLRCLRWRGPEPSPLCRCRRRCQTVVWDNQGLWQKPR